MYSVANCTHAHTPRENQQLHDQSQHMSCNSRSASRNGGHVPAVFTCTAFRACSTWCCSRCTIHKIQKESRYTHIYIRVCRHIRESWIQSYAYIRHSTSGLGACSTKRKVRAWTPMYSITAHTQTTSIINNSNSYNSYIWVVVIVGAQVGV